jgi:hypothetical protein
MKSIRIKWAGHVACMGDWRVLYRVLVGKPEEKVTLGKLKRKRENITKTDFQEEKYIVML